LAERILWLAAAGPRGRRRHHTEPTVPVASARHAPDHGRSVTTSGMTVNIPIE